MLFRYTIPSLYIFFIFHLNCFSEKLTYINVEHPHVTYWNPDFITYVNLTTTRYSRSNPVYYVGLNFESLGTLDRNVLIDFYFLEFLTNVYKPSFIELHYNWCTMLEKDLFFGAAIKRALVKKQCPHPPDTYYLSNMTLDPSAIPKAFPFRKGRIVCNLTHAKTKERIVNGYIDMTLMRMDKNKARF